MNSRQVRQYCLQNYIESNAALVLFLSFIVALVAILFFGKDYYIEAYALTAALMNLNNLFFAKKIARNLLDRIESAD